MIVFNLTGFYGLGLALATGWAYGEWISPAVLPHFDTRFHFATLVAGIFGLLVDRHQTLHGVKPSFFAGYAQSWSDFSNNLFGRRQRYRLAVFMIPLAFVPLVFSGPVFIFWCIDLFGQLRAISSSWYAQFFSASGVCLVIWSAVGVASQKLRYPG